jgi:hypothetical protein
MFPPEKLFSVPFSAASISLIDTFFLLPETAAEHDCTDRNIKTNRLETPYNPRASLFLSFTKRKQCLMRGESTWWKAKFSFALTGRGKEKYLRWSFFRSNLARQLDFRQARSIELRKKCNFLLKQEQTRADCGMNHAYAGFLREFSSFSACNIFEFSPADLIRASPWLG